MSGVDILHSRPACGPLSCRDWTSTSIVDMCQAVASHYSPESAGNTRGFSQNRQQDDNLVFSLEDVQEPATVADSTGDSPRPPLVSTSDGALRTISPGVREAREAARFFVIPDWDAIERADANYEATLFQRRAEGHLLFFVNGGQSLRDGCRFVVTDPQWLLSQFFFNSQRVHESVTPYLWMQRPSQVVGFWRALRPNAAAIAPNQLCWEAECVMALLIHCGIGVRVSSANRYNICFPVRMFCEADEMPSDDIVLDESNLRSVCSLPNGARRDAVAYQLALFICTACDPVALPETHYNARFFREHVIIVDHFHEAALIVDLFSTPDSIRMFKDEDFECDQRLLETLVLLIDNASPARTPGELFKVARTCCTNTCALCVFGDVVRALFVCEWADLTNAAHGESIAASVVHACTFGSD